MFPGWRQWVRVKSRCWLTQRRRSSYPQSPLWTSVWTTRPWTPAWSVTAHRLTTTMWCATPRRLCNLLLPPWRIWLTAPRPLLCSPLFWLLSLDCSVAKFGRRTHEISFQKSLERMLWDELWIYSTVTSASSNIQGVCCAAKGNL